jgi:hypothetical protein
LSSRIDLRATRDDDPRHAGKKVNLSHPEQFETKLLLHSYFAFQKIVIFVFGTLCTKHDPALKNRL